MRNRLATWITAVLVATVASSPLAALSVHSRCITQHHACESAAAIVDCCCTHFGTNTQSATLIKTDPPTVASSPVAILPRVESRSSVALTTVDRPLPFPPPLQIDRVILQRTLLI